MRCGVLAAAAVAGAAGSVTGQEQVWGRQFGTATDEYGLGVAVDGSGNAYVSGETWGDLFGLSAGGWDAFLAKYDAAGNRVWARQFGSATNDYGRGGVAVDSAGGVYVAGRTGGGLFGPNPYPVYSDVFLAKYDGAGNRVWGRQFGSKGHEGGLGIAVDTGGNTYVTGPTSGDLFGTNAGGTDAFLARYDGVGTQTWGRRFGTGADDTGYGAAADRAGHVYVTGNTSGSLFGPNAQPPFADIFLAKYDAAGNQVWGRQLGTTDYDTGMGVAVDSAGNVYVTGYTRGSLFGPNPGALHAFLAKYDSAGNLLWGRQFGSASPLGLDRGLGVAVDAVGGAYVAGDTLSLSGPNYGSFEVSLTKFDAAGNEVWRRRFGTSTDEFGAGVAVDSTGGAYVAGGTWGSLFGPSAGEADALLIKVNTLPCYANCDVSTLAPALNVNDFVCFLNRFARGDTYANCDGSTTPPVLNTADFVCFTNAFAAGCP